MLAYVIVAIPFQSVGTWCLVLQKPVEKRTVPSDAVVKNRAQNTWH